MGVILTSLGTNIAAFIGKFASSAVFCALFTFSAELFPTEVRSMGVSVTSMIGRIGSVVAPFLNMLIDEPGKALDTPIIFFDFNLTRMYTALDRV